MPEVLGFDHLYISVSDLPRSQAFYDRVLREVTNYRQERRDRHDHWDTQGPG